MTLYRRNLGIAGEAKVVAWYEAAGYTILDRNWRCAGGEIDIVCRAGSTVVFCEVKTRTTTAFGAPVEAVTPAKRRRVRRAAARWLRERRPACRNVRFDVASVTGGGVEVVADAW